MDLQSLDSNSPSPAPNPPTREFGTWVVNDLAIWHSFTVTGLSEDTSDENGNTVFTIYLPVLIHTGGEEPDVTSDFVLNNVVPNTHFQLDQSEPGAEDQWHVISNRYLTEVEGMSVEDIPSTTPGRRSRRQWRKDGVVVLVALQYGNEWVVQPLNAAEQREYFLWETPAPGTAPTPLSTLATSHWYYEMFSAVRQLAPAPLAPGELPGPCQAPNITGS